MYKATANLPLHHGKAPRWLFEKMVRLSRAIVQVIVEEFGPSEVLVRLSNPYWFQAFGCMLGFDWHSSGVTTTVMGAVKEGLKGFENDLGLFVAGGKGKTSRKTPDEIVEKCEKASLPDSFLNLVKLSRLTAKIDNNALQDGYQLYHHVFLFSGNGEWGVVQQGMNEKNKEARRYHWYSQTVKDLVSEPHAAICCDASGTVLNLVAEESLQTRSSITELANENPEKLLREIRSLEHLSLPHRHHVLLEDLHLKSLEKTFLLAYQARPASFLDLVGTEGVGGKTLRALTLLAELLYGEKVSTRDPVKFSFAHGGKDGHPFPVDRETYEQTIFFLHDAIQKARLGEREKMEALKRLVKR